MIAPLHESHPTEPAPIFAAVLDLHTRPVLRVIVCPTCHATSGHECRTSSGRKSRWHAGRRSA